MDEALRRPTTRDVVWTTCNAYRPPPCRQLRVEHWGNALPAGAGFRRHGRYGPSDSTMSFQTRRIMIRLLPVPCQNPTWAVTCRSANCLYVVMISVHDRSCCLHDRGSSTGLARAAVTSSVRVDRRGACAAPRTRRPAPPGHQASPVLAGPGNSVRAVPAAATPATPLLMLRALSLVE